MIRDVRRSAMAGWAIALAALSFSGTHVNELVALVECKLRANTPNVEKDFEARLGFQSITTKERL